MPKIAFKNENEEQTKNPRADFFAPFYYITFKMENGTGKDLINSMFEEIKRNGIDPFSLVDSKESPVFEKYDDSIPSELLRKAYAADRLNVEEVCIRMEDIIDEF